LDLGCNLIILLFEIDISDLVNEINLVINFEPLHLRLVKCLAMETGLRLLTPEILTAKVAHCCGAIGDAVQVNTVVVPCPVQ